MEWILWIVVGLLVLGVIANILTIGKPKEPTTPALAAGTAILAGLYIWAIIAIGIYQ